MRQAAYAYTLVKTFATSCFSYVHLPIIASFVVD